jgi:hypothetical protein
MTDFSEKPKHGYKNPYTSPKTIFGIVEGILMMLAGLSIILFVNFVLN